MSRRVLVSTVVVSALLLVGCATGPDIEPGAASPSSTHVSISPPPGTSISPRATPIPDTLAFTAKTLDGADFVAARLAGRPVVFWFWAPWCPSCRVAAPVIVMLAQRVTVVGVPGLSDDLAGMRRFVAETNTGGFVHLGDGAVQVWQRFGVASQESYVMIGSDGAVAFKGQLDPATAARRAVELT